MQPWYQKGVDPYEYMNDEEKFNEISLLKKEYFHSQLNIEDITDADYTPHKKVFVKIYEITMMYMFKVIDYC